MTRLRGNASGRNGSLRWLCSGCGQKHPISRTIEGIDGANKFCGAHIRRAARAEKKARYLALLLKAEVKTSTRHQSQLPL